MKKNFLLSIVLAAAFISLAAASHFELPDPENVTFDISTMLTPWGILNFLVLDPSHPLSPYYGQVTQREGFLERPWLIVLVLVVIGSALALLRNNFRPILFSKNTG